VLFCWLCRHAKGIRLWDPVHRKVKIGRDLRFDEQLSSKQRSSTESFSDSVTPVEFEVGGDLQVSTGRSAEFNSLPGETLDNAETTGDANEHEEPFHGFESTDTPDNGTRTRQTTQIIKRPQRLIEDTNFLSFDQHVPQVLDEPQTYEDAINGPQANQWKIAMQEELNSLKINNTWGMASLPPERKPIKNKWV
jgi:hypothetical protein